MRSHRIVLAISVLVLAVIGTIAYRRRARESEIISRSEIAYAPPETQPAKAWTRPEPPTHADAQAVVRAPSTDLDRALGPPKWQVRPAGEWDGMLVNLNVTPPCESPSGCGMARACKGGKCQPCVYDVECAPGETCVLDHCVKTENVSCRRRTECPEGSICLLSGYSNGVRGNENMKAYCVASASGEQRSPSRPAPKAVKDTRPHLPDDDLLNRAKAAQAK